MTGRASTLSIRSSTTRHFVNYECLEVKGLEKKQHQSECNLKRRPAGARFHGDGDTLLLLRGVLSLSMLLSRCKQKQTRPFVTRSLAQRPSKTKPAPGCMRSAYNTNTASRTPLLFPWRSMTLPPAINMQSHFFSQIFLPDYLPKSDLFIKFFYASSKKKQPPVLSAYTHAGQRKLVVC